MLDAEDVVIILITKPRRDAASAAILTRS